MLNIAFEKCQPNAEDAELILRWRNNPNTLKMFYHNKPQTFDEFFPYYKNNYFCEAELTPLFIVQDNQRVGFLRFTNINTPAGYHGRTMDISINIAPEKRGQGVGQSALRALPQYFLSNSDYNNILAEIKKYNTASRKAFEQSGFVFLDEIVKHIAELQEDFHILRFIKIIRR